jgi:chorismate synthase
VAGSSFGRLFRITTFGESHGAALGVVIDGCPAELPLAEDDLIPDLGRRRPGQSRVTSSRAERDEPRIVSGVFEGKTTGAPICVLFENTDARSRDYEPLRDVYRPGHADFTYEARYGHRDHRGGGRASARETVSRVAAGAVARKILALEGVDVVGYARSIGGETASAIDPATVRAEDVERSVVRCPDSAAAERMEALIAAVRKEGDSIGGVAEIVARGVPAGLGDPVFDKLEADLAKGILSIPAVTGFEYGTGFGAAVLRGSQHNDAFGRTSDARIHALTNRHGGILGGISSGSPIVVRAALKPTSSIPIAQTTVTRAGETATIRVGGRHDPCLVPRFVPVGEAMMALVLVDHLLRARAARMREGAAR